MIIKENYYVLRTKSTPIKFYIEDEGNWLTDDFRTALKFGNRKTMELYIGTENEIIRRIRNDDSNFFEDYEPMLVHATYEF